MHSLTMKFSIQAWLEIILTSIHNNFTINNWGEHN